MVRAQNLVKTVGTVTAVEDVSVDVAEGEIFAFLGPNGAGKTTTIKIADYLAESHQRVDRTRRPQPREKPE